MAGRTRRLRGKISREKETNGIREDNRFGEKKKKTDILNEREKRNILKSRANEKARMNEK